jgi:hypothetical protein
MGGAELINQPGTYGVQGTASTANTPSARFGAVGWTDTKGNLWLFGGSSGTNSVAPLNDLWMFGSGEWTWMSGSTNPDQSGTYGTRGSGSAGNTTGVRVYAVTWTGTDGSLWLFGGDGYESAGLTGALNDLWNYRQGQWTWISGSAVVGQTGTYGTLGSGGPGNAPGERGQAVGWKDVSGNFWLFGGLGYDSVGTLGQLNDLWMTQP